MKDKTIPMARPTVDEETIRVTAEVLQSGQLSQGPYLEEFEGNLANFVTAEHAAAVSSGTSALMIALIACGVRPGDEVITVSLSFAATANAIVAIGAVPVFVDVLRSDLNMNPELIAAAVSERTRAIVVVHLFGMMADMAAVMAVADSAGLPVVEDACEALGAEGNGMMAGGVGHAAVFGFYANKPLTTAEGGMVVSNDEELIERCRRLRNQQPVTDDLKNGPAIGYSFRLSELHAALGVAQLRQLKTNLHARRDLARRYRDKLNGLEQLVLPGSAALDDQVSWFTYPVRLTDSLVSSRDRIRELLAEDNIDTRDYFTPIHQMPYFQANQECWRMSSLPVTVSESPRLIALPLFAGMASDQVDRVASSLERVLAIAESSIQS